MKKINKITTILFLPLLMIFSSCFDPIFYEVRRDVAPESATVSGNIGQITRFTMNGEEYLLTMHNSQNYSLINAHNSEVLRIMHKGIAGGWAVEDHSGFTPEIICGIFIFCRYIEQENEFLIV